MRLGQIGIWRLHRHGTDTVPEIEALATNMVVVATYWMSYEYVSINGRPVNIS